MSGRSLRWKILLGKAYWIPPPEWRDTPFSRRRQFFERHRYTHGKGAGVCAACGFPTLTQQVKYDYCSACHWEDDGSDDPDANEVSQVNGGITLNQARNNVLDNGTMFSHADVAWMHPSSYESIFSEEAYLYRKRMFQLFDGLMELNDDEAMEQQWILLQEHWSSA